MLIIPELETIVILVPRTGTGSLYRALQAKYPRAMLLYRHMEADGVPLGYSTYDKVGVVREPISRLWSLYNYLRADWSGAFSARPAERDLEYERAISASVDRPFEDWLLNNSATFSASNTGLHQLAWPTFTQLHPIPDTRKSQRVWLRPDLGTQIHQFARGTIYRRLGIERPEIRNALGAEPMPPLSRSARAHIVQHFSWDLREAH